MVDGFKNMQLLGQGYGSRTLRFCSKVVKVLQCTTVLFFELLQLFVSLELVIFGIKNRQRRFFFDR